MSSFFMGCAKIAAYQIFRARSASTTYSSSEIGSLPMRAGLCRTAQLAYLLKFHACSFSIWTFSVFWSGSAVVVTLSFWRPVWRCAMTVQLKLDARMRQANTPDLSAMKMPTLLRLEKNVPEWFEETLAKTATEEHENVKKMTQNSKRKLKELISVAFQLRTSKALKLKQIPRSSSPRTCGFKPLSGIFPTAERPDNRMKKRLMTKPWRGRRTKEHRVIPANDPNVPNTNSWGKQMKDKTQNPETKRAHQINHLMVASSRHKYGKKCLQGFLKTLNL